MLLTILDYAGTFVFALSGAAAGVRQRLDLFGVLVLSFAAASAGGILRDLLIGSLPPAAIRDWAYPALAGAAGLLVFFCFPLVHRLRHPVQVFDAAGLALYAVLGTQKALLFDINPLAAVMLGIMSGIGGGMLRDMLLAQVPQVLKAEVYAVAALAGAVVVVVADALSLPPVVGVAAGGLLCFVIRLLAIRYGWRLVAARPMQDDDPKS